jgi:NAD(P)-dependent dehydrogenase (short-subunit alcohol dehydrogenase family)
MKLEGKKVLITGGGSGIGLELAHRLADANDVVIAGGSTHRLGIAHERDPRLRPIQLDVTSNARRIGISGANCTCRVARTWSLPCRGHDLHGRVDVFSADPSSARR